MEPFLTRVKEYTLSKYNDGLSPSRAILGESGRIGEDRFLYETVPGQIFKTSAVGSFPLHSPLKMLILVVLYMKDKSASF